MWILPGAIHTNLPPPAETPAGQQPPLLNECAVLHGQPPGARAPAAAMPKYMLLQLLLHSILHAKEGKYTHVTREHTHAHKSTTRGEKARATVPTAEHTGKHTQKHTQTHTSMPRPCWLALTAAGVCKLVEELQGKVQAPGWQGVRSYDCSSCTMHTAQQHTATRNEDDLREDRSA